LPSATCVWEEISYAVLVVLYNAHEIAATLYQKPGA
jgi:hypothetical protein